VGNYAAGWQSRDLIEPVPARAGGKVRPVDKDRAAALLGRERERVEKALAEQAGENDGGTATVDQHLADQGSELYADEFEAGLRERLLTELAALERAEMRLAEGTYGLSVESGEPIPDERLEAIPTAERTADEQARFEGRRR
jgi:DnaK suppressor protein